MKKKKQLCYLHIYLLILLNKYRFHQDMCFITIKQQTLRGEYLIYPILTDFDNVTN